MWKLLNFSCIPYLILPFFLALGRKEQTCFHLAPVTLLSFFSKAPLLSPFPSAAIPHLRQWRAPAFDSRVQTPHSLQQWQWWGPSGAGPPRNCTLGATRTPGASRSCIIISRGCVRTRVVCVKVRATGWSARETRRGECGGPPARRAPKMRTAHLAPHRPCTFTISAASRWVSYYHRARSKISWSCERDARCQSSMPPTHTQHYCPRF